MQCDKCSMMSVYNSQWYLCFIYHARVTRFIWHIKRELKGPPKVNNFPKDARLLV